MRVSLREKILIFILLTLLAVFGIYKYMYQPISTEYKANKLAFQDLSLQYQLQRTQAEKYADIDETISEAKEVAAKAAEPFFPSLAAEKINVWLGDSIHQSGLAVTGMSFSEQETVTIGEIYYDAPEPAYPIGGYADAFLSEEKPEATDDAQPSDAPAADQNQAMPEDSVLGVTVSLELSGPVSGLNTFCGEILDCGKTVLIREMSYAFETEEDRLAGSAAMHVTLVFYAVPQASDTVFR